MRRLGLLFLVLLAACSTIQPTPERFGASVPISQWPIPATGSPDITNGDAFVGTRGGVSYKLLADFGGTCPTNQWVASISGQGVPSCTQPGFSSLTGFVALNQLAGLYSNGQLLIGNGSTGFLQAGTLAATNNISIANSAGGISVNGSMTPTFTTVTSSGETVNGLTNTHGTISNGTTFTIASGCGTGGSAPSSLTGGATTGSFVANVTACVPVISLPTAPNGWMCSAHDITNPADTFTQTAKSVTTCTLSATVSTSDVITFHAEGY